MGQNECCLVFPLSLQPSPILNVNITMRLWKFCIFGENIMSFDYEAIKQEHIKEHDALVDRVGAYLTNMYSDQTHFIYELLQNAEDAEATEVKFRLYQDRLELEHDGCQFDEADVGGICKLISGTKNEDLTKIGKFGVGFMSVYAHTRSPQIHSGDAHFTIDNYEQPREIPLQSSALGTLFIFPFNLEGKDPGESFDEISERLKDLGASTLLFLKHIKSIGYEIDKEATGTYLRQTDPIQGTDFVSDITVIGQRNLHDAEERWLVFEKDVTHLVGSISEGGSLTVQIAFRYSDDSQDVPKFECLSQSNLVVYFPTEKETHLGFLMQGPYKTTPARDNIPQSDSFNVALSEQTGDLVVEALRWLRDRNWLTIDVLNAMPLKSYSFFNTLFEPIYNKVLAAIRNEALIPAYDEGYVSGQNAKLAGSEALRNLLDSARLQQFFNTDEPLRWVSDEITERRTPELRKYLMDKLSIEEIDAEKFARRIGKDFLSCQSDNWVREFYEFASGQGGIQHILESKPIIRLQNDSHVVPSANVYLPTERDSQFPTIKKEVCNSGKSLTFLRNLGLKEPDIFDEVRELILPEYKNGKVDVDDVKHWQDIETIVKAIRKVLDLSEGHEKRRGLIDELKKTPFLLVTNDAVHAIEFRCPEEIYRRSPELEMYFEGNPDAWFLSAGYEAYAADLEQIGVASQVRVCCKISWGLYVEIERSRGWHVRGLNGFDPNCEIDGLEFALKRPKVEHAEFIWEHLLIPHKHLISGDVESCTRGSFVGSEVEEDQESKMGKLVRNTAWLPNGRGEFVVPSEITLDKLPDGFSKDKQLATQLAMLGTQRSEQAILEEALDNAGVTETTKQRIKKVLEVDQEHPGLLDDIEEFVEYKRKKEANTKQTSEVNGASHSAVGILVSSGHLAGTGNVSRSESGTVRQPGKTHINNGSQLEREDIEKAAMVAVMQEEIALGNTPCDVSNSRNLGYDIESRTPEGCSRFIEVKGRSTDDGAVTLTRNEVHCALNNSQEFILALVKVVDGCPELPRYLPGHSWLESVPSFNFNLQRLLERCHDPS